MSFTQKLKLIDELREEIDRQGILPDPLLRKINYKLRLDWNYYSNSIEGNTLTMLETRSIMIGNVTVNGKPVKDVMEMKGHDDVVNEIFRIGKSELNISETRIRNIHRGIMHEDDPEKQTWIGRWKQNPNYIYNFRGERFDFTAPADVETEMHLLNNRVNKEKEKIERKDKAALHPVELALQFHLDFITIHPFYDGNGRTARILTNLILISYGYPPLYVKNDERNSYHQYLGEIQGYGAKPDLFYEFMADLLSRSLQLTMDAINGKDIEEETDLDKELFLLKNAVKQKETTPPIIPRRPGVDDVLIKYLGALIKALHIKLKTVRDMFNENEEAVLLPEFNGTQGAKVPLESIIGIYDVIVEGAKNKFRILLTSDKFYNENIQIAMWYNRIEELSNDITVQLIIPFKFNNYTYVCLGLDNEALFTKNYNEFYSNEEIDLIVKTYVKKIISDIKTATEIN